jgi:hypothetical protein
MNVEAAIAYLHRKRPRPDRIRDAMEEVLRAAGTLGADVDDHRESQQEGGIGLDRRGTWFTWVYSTRGKLQFRAPPRPEHLAALPHDVLKPGKRTEVGTRILLSRVPAEAQGTVVRVALELLHDSYRLSREEAGAAVPRSPVRGQLRPFKPKADSECIARIEGGTQRRDRAHERLVNPFREWLQAHGFDPRSNMAIDIGLDDPPVVVEAKTLPFGTRQKWTRAIREAVGLLYEYRYFQVVRPDSELIFLASHRVPEDWVRYLEDDRHIGVAWQEGDGFRLSILARTALGLDE